MDQYPNYPVYLIFESFGSYHGQIQLDPKSKYMARFKVSLERTNDIKDLQLNHTKIVQT